MRGICGHEIHPAADLFPLMGDAEMQELAHDIKKRGLQEPISRDEAGLVYDGRNRLIACRRAGVEPRFIVVVVDDPVAFVISANIRRRHLTTAQKTELIEKLLKLDPGKSDRQIAAQTKTSPTKVGKVRKAREAAGDVSIVDTRTDTKGRQQPASKPKSVQSAEAVINKERAKPSKEPAVLKAPIARDPDRSVKALKEFKWAVDHWVPLMNAADLETAKAYFISGFVSADSRAKGQAEISEDERRAQNEKLAEAEMEKLSAS